MRLEEHLAQGTSVEETLELYQKKRNQIEARYFQLHDNKTQLFSNHMFSHEYIKHKMYKIFIYIYSYVYMHDDALPYI